MFKNIVVIAEVKPRSPTHVSEHSWEELFKTASFVGDWISIHTNKLWGGSLDLIDKARERSDKPILAKGFHDTDAEISEAIARGASFVLVAGRIPRVHEDKCLIEPYGIDGLLDIPDGFKIVWNSRDIEALRKGSKPREKEPFSEARALRPRSWLCQASNVKTFADVHFGANAVLVGTHLMSFAESLLRL